MEESLNIKDRIKIDFGIELNLGEGLFKGDRTEPVLVLDEDLEKATLTSLKYLRYINEARNRYWKGTDTEIINKDSHVQIQFSLEEIILNVEDYYIDQTKYYFDCPNIAYSDSLAIYQPIIGLDKQTQMYIPYVLSWCRFDDYTVNSPDSMGRTYSFSSNNIRANLYVYDRGLNNIGSGINDSVRAEFMDNVAEINLVHPHLELWGSSVDLDDVLMQFYLSENIVSVLVLTSLKDQFVKLRISASSEPELDGCLKETISAFRFLTSECRNRTSM